MMKKNYFEPQSKHENSLNKLPYSKNYIIIIPYVSRDLNLETKKFNFNPVFHIK